MVIMKITPSLVAKLPELREREHGIANQISALNKKLAKLSDLIEVLSKVTEFYHGVPLCVVKSSGMAPAWDISALDNDRYADIYHNANVHSTVDKYGLHTYTDMCGLQGCMWHGADLPLAEAMEMAKRWVALGVRDAS